MDGCGHGDEYECHCECHDPQTGKFVDHIAPCCETAPCGLRIVTGAMQLHIYRCGNCRAKKNEFVHELVAAQGQ